MLTKSPESEDDQRALPRTTSVRANYSKTQSRSSPKCRRPGIWQAKYPDESQPSALPLSSAVIRSSSLNSVLSCMHLYAASTIIAYSFYQKTYTEAFQYLLLFVLCEPLYELAISLFQLKNNPCCLRSLSLILFFSLLVLFAANLDRLIPAASLPLSSHVVCKARWLQDSRL